MIFQNKKILVAGLGGTGISMIAYLRKNGAEVAAYDAELKPERVSQIGKMFDGLVFYTGRLKDALDRSEEHTSELQSPDNLVCRLLLEKKKIRTKHKKSIKPSREIGRASCRERV